jgi:Protein of unknown function (DUF3016)
MKHTVYTLALAFAVMAGAAPARAGGSVSVSFSGDATFSDAGAAHHDRELNLAILTRHLQGLGQRYLPDGEALSVEILDLDLAGALRLSHRAVGEVRIVRGRADWPRIKLRYSLAANGQTLQSATESLADLNYLGHIGTYSSSDPLRYEKRMLEDWFKARFVEHLAAQK